MWTRARGYEKCFPLLLPTELFLPRGLWKEVGLKVSLATKQQGSGSEETQPLKQKEELIIVVPVQISFLINYNNYCTTPSFSSLAMALMP